MHRPWWHRLAWEPGLLVLLALISVAGHMGEEERLLALVKRCQPAWLFAAPAVQAVTYFSAAGVWRGFCARGGIPRRSQPEMRPAKVQAPSTAGRL